MKRVLVLSGLVLVVVFSGSCLMFLRAGDEHTVVKTLEFGGEKRSYRLHVPPKLDREKPAAVVFVLHGGGGNARQIERETKFSALSDTEGFIAVYPDGADNQWNCGREVKGSRAHTEKIDDVGFLVAVLEAVKKDHKVDAGRVFATGISNGGFMSARLAADRPDVFAAVGVVTATMAEDLTFEPKEPAAILVINGTEDPLVPYDGGTVAKNRGTCIPTSEFVKRWVKRNGCGETGREETLADEDPKDECIVKRTTWSGGKAEVVLVRIEGGGHTWPGGSQYLPQRFVGRVCRDIDGTREIWEFFKSHGR